MIVNGLTYEPWLADALVPQLTTANESWCCLYNLSVGAQLYGVFSLPDKRKSYDTELYANTKIY